MWSLLGFKSRERCNCCLAQKNSFFFGAKCVGWANLCQTVGFWWMVILVILKSLCGFWFCRVAISPLLYSVSFNSKTSWSFGPILLGMQPLEYLGSTTWRGGPCVSQNLISRLLNERLGRHDLHSVAASLDAIPLKLGPCPERLVCTWKWMVSFSLAFWRQRQMLTPDVLWLQVRSAQLRLLNTVSPALRTRKHQPNVSMD